LSLVLNKIRSGDFQIPGQKVSVFYDITLESQIKIALLHRQPRVTSLEQLSLAEFSGE
jgi:hypothetical protein